MLKPLYDADNRPILHNLPPPRTCESCGTVVPIGHDAINVIIVVGSGGHPDIVPFQCLHEEHWACSPECWKKVAHACIDEHMHVLLQVHHKTVGL